MKLNIENIGILIGAVAVAYVLYKAVKTKDAITSFGEVSAPNGTGGGTVWV